MNVVMFLVESVLGEYLIESVRILCFVLEFVEYVKKDGFFVMKDVL